MHFSFVKFVAMFKFVFPFFRLMLVIAVITANISFAFAQETFTLNGAVFQKQTNLRVANALISGKKSTVVTDDLGIFHIKVSIGDTLKISKADFSDVFYVVDNQKDVIIQLPTMIQLQEVKIFGKTKTQELNDAMHMYRSQGSFYNGKPPITAFLPFGGSPITGLYELFGKTPNQAKRFQKFAKTETEQIDIDKRFTKALIKENTDLKDEQIQPFMDSYRPSFDQMKNWNDYDLINYIKKSAQGFKDGKGLPPLKKLY